MKTVKIISAAKAAKVLKENPSFSKCLYCTKKYKHTAFAVGSDMDVHDGVVAIFTSRGSDEYGPYKKLHCIKEGYAEENEVYHDSL